MLTFGRTGGVAQRNRVLSPSATQNGWGMWNLKQSCVIKPYPIVDANGQPCAGYRPDARGTDCLPDCFVGGEVADFAGRDRLSFCTSVIDAPEGCRMPYSILQKSIEQLTPYTPKPGGKGRPRVPAYTPRQAMEWVVTNEWLPRPREACFVRGIMVNAADEMTKYAPAPVPHYSALLMIAVNITDIATNYQNCGSQMEALFTDPDLALKFRKMSVQQSSPYMLELVRLDQNLLGFYPDGNPATGGQAFIEYAASLQSTLPVTEQFNLMTLEEHFDMLREQFPASLLGYAFRDHAIYRPYVEDEVHEMENDPDFAPLVSNHAVSVGQIQAQPQQYQAPVAPQQPPVRTAPVVAVPPPAVAKAVAASTVTYPTPAAVRPPVAGGAAPGFAKPPAFNAAPAASTPPARAGGFAPPPPKHMPPSHGVVPPPPASQDTVDNIPMQYEADAATAAQLNAAEAAIQQDISNKVD